MCFSVPSCVCKQAHDVHVYQLKIQTDDDANATGLLHVIVAQLSWVRLLILLMVHPTVYIAV